MEEEVRGGHTIARHVGKADEFLLRRLETEVYRGLLFTVGLERAGTFPSIEAAQKLTSSTLAQNSTIVDNVVDGEVSDALVKAFFGSTTGREAYRANDECSRSYERQMALAFRSYETPGQ